MKLRRRRDALLKTAWIGNSEDPTPTPEDSLVEKYVIRALNHCRRRLNIEA